MPIKHSLGFGNGRIIEYEDGTAGYIKSMEFTQAFRVPIADVTGFSVVNEGKMLERTFRVMGGGSVLAAVSVNHGVSEHLENWFRAHPAFRTNAPATASHVAGRSSPQRIEQRSETLLIADELHKLAELVAAGILTQQEFDTRKQLLLSRAA